MKKTFQIIRYELNSALRRPSFLILAFGLPIIAAIAIGGYSYIKSTQVEQNELEQTPEDQSLSREGFIDFAGLIEEIPSDLPEGILVPYLNEAEAQSALLSDEIEAYYIIPEDFVSNGELIYVNPETNPISDGGQDWLMRWTLYVNLLGGDMEAASNIWNPGNFQWHNLSQINPGGTDSSNDCLTPGYSCDSNVLIQLLPLAVMAIIYISIITGGSYLLRLISSEKDTRIMEVLLLSASPDQLLVGKIISYCFLGFLQVLAWLGSVYVIFNIGAKTINIPSGFTIPASLIVWGLIFFLVGFAVYASLMAGAGALTPKLSQYTSVYFIVSTPLMISYVLSLILARNPHSGLATGLSIFPLSAPVMMITRLTVGGVPFWQPVLAAFLTICVAIFIIRAVARMFHAQVLLSGQPFSIKSYMIALVNS
ncbi:MAG: ABC transporter permease [Chloroflexota bacterium]|nr:MAG: ABC transporter permease [Chloroflexota bacterium]